MSRRSIVLRRVVLVALAAMLAAACGAAGDEGLVDLEGSGGSDDTDDGGPSSVPPTQPGDEPDGSAAPETTTSVNAGGGGGGETTTTEAPTQAPVPAVGPVGAYAKLYLSPEESAATVIEIFAQEGAAPRAGTVDHLESVLETVSGKEVSVAMGAIGGGGQSWSSEEIRALADANGADQSRDRSVLKLFYLRGDFEPSDTAVGVAVRSDAAAVFADKVTESAGVLGNRAAVEDAVSLHEVGHVLGLVDLVLDTGREDPEHPGHSPNRDSVMYYAVESTLLGTILEGGPPREFDQADLDDLATIRNS